MQMRASVFILIMLFTASVSAETLPIVTVTETEGETQYSLTLQLLALMTLLSLLPAMLLGLTSFIRIIIVLSLLRQALGTMQTPPNQVLLGIALFLTFFIMAPVFNEIYDTAILPYLNAEIPIDAAIAAAESPIRGFMLNQTRQEDIGMFVQIAGIEAIPAPEDVPFEILAPAFITSELKSAFIIAFMIYIPFVVIDLIVASVLMSMGMMMLSPMMISMPFKLMLFVLVDGWTLIMGSLASSFAMP
jgi:flagellar biosynthetic protein FliP